jgi:hypothetical protein
MAVAWTQKAETILRNSKSEPISRFFSFMNTIEALAMYMEFISINHVFCAVGTMMDNPLPYHCHARTVMIDLPKGWNQMCISMEHSLLRTIQWPFQTAAFPVRFKNRAFSSLQLAVPLHGLLFDVHLTSDIPSFCGRSSAADLSHLPLLSVVQGC